MKEIANPTSASAFEAKYRANPDPWNFANSKYEQYRYAETLGALKRHRYGTVYEPGCSVGELTVRLSERCEKVIASDVSITAIERARSRCIGSTNVCFHVSENLTEVPSEALDLVVFSEIGYYFEIGELASYAWSLGEALQKGGEFVAVHWLGHSDDHRLHGDTVHRQLFRSLNLTWLSGQRYSGFRIDSWIRHA